MKTTQLSAGKVTDGMLFIIILCTSLLGFTGCQKEELATPGISSVSTADVSDSRIRSSASTAVFTVFIIDHEAAQTGMADYRLEINSDGTVLFHGRRNTAFIGTKELKLSAQTVRDLRDLYIENSFETITDNFVPAADLPQTTTTFKGDASLESITFIDDNFETPIKVIELRKALEERLQISSYINKERKINNTPEKMNPEHN